MDAMRPVDDEGANECCWDALEADCCDDCQCEETLANHVIPVRLESRNNSGRKEVLAEMLGQRCGDREWAK